MIQIGPKIVYTCKECNNLGTLFYRHSPSYYCKIDDSLVVKTTLNTPDNCYYMRQIVRKKKLESLCQEQQQY